VLSAFTLVRNALTLNFPIVAAICSVLGVCDEVVVNVGRSDDETREVIESIGDSRIRIIENVWDSASTARIRPWRASGLRRTRSSPIRGSSRGIFSPRMCACMRPIWSSG
jgi:hypothetical protein